MWLPFPVQTLPDYGRLWRNLVEVALGTAAFSGATFPHQARVRLARGLEGRGGGRCYRRPRRTSSACCRTWLDDRRLSLIASRPMRCWRALTCVRWWAAGQLMRSCRRV